MTIRAVGWSQPVHRCDENPSHLRNSRGLGGGRFARIQATPWTEIFVTRRKIQHVEEISAKKSSIGKRPQLNNAPKMRGVCEIYLDVMECKDTTKHARKKLEVRMASPKL